MTYLAKIGELSLKGLNIRTFERLLLRNIRRYVAGRAVTASVHAGRLIVSGEAPDEAAIVYTLSHVLGITGWAPACVCEKTAAALCTAVYAAAERARHDGAQTFKVEARRADKHFPLTSYEICCQTAAPICDSGLLTVDVHHPDAVIHVEVRDSCYVYTEQHVGCRGLPVGSSGRGLLLLSGGIDSPVAGYRMMRRGMHVDCIYFHAYPYTSAEAQHKVESLAETLAGYGLDVNLAIVPFTDVQLCIKKKSPPEWTTLMLRACMMRCARLLAQELRADCLITGESLGQVASQTIENMAVTEHFAQFPLLRPLVGLDKEEITATARTIGTYETSILPYEDCCVLFSPKHPVLHASVAEAEKIYATCAPDDLIAAAYAARETKRYTVETILHSL
ncbi:MAG: tRNA 4-thiouridine(8) synthase ThiI [Treponema sp.]|nr:tRNA 4-thiouridine(8) synthase ThiI [Treponema sp.]